MQRMQPQHLSRSLGNLPKNEQMKDARAAVIQKMTESIVGEVLADIPLDCITPATMHVILGFTKKIVDWILVSFLKLKLLEEKKTKGKTTYQFKQDVGEGMEKVVAYEKWLLTNFGGVIQTVEGKKNEFLKLMKLITTAEEKIASTHPGKQQTSWIEKLVKLKAMEQTNTPTHQEVEASKHFVEQLCIANQTRTELEAILKKHKGDSSREFVKAMHKHGLDQQVYHT